MTTFDPTSLEDKLFTLLDVHRGDASEHVLRVQAGMLLVPYLNPPLTHLCSPHRLSDPE